MWDWSRMIFIRLLAWPRWTSFHRTMDKSYAPCKNSGPNGHLGTPFCILLLVAELLSAQIVCSDLFWDLYITSMTPVDFVPPMKYVGTLSFALGSPLAEMGVQLNTFWSLTSPLLSIMEIKMCHVKIQVPTVILVPHFAFCDFSLRSYWAHKSYVVHNFEIYICIEYFIKFSSQHCAFA